MPIFRIPINNKPDEFVILNVQPHVEERPKCEAKLIGTDNLFVYTLELTQWMVDQALSTKADLDDKEWTKLLKDILFTGASMPDIRLEAQVEPKKKMDIIFYRTVEGGYKQRLGVFSLARTKDEEIRLIDWCGGLADQVQDLVAKLLVEKRQIEMLQRQNEELIHAKNLSEKEMIGKCLRLINTKKDKIEVMAQKLRAYENGDVPEPMEGVEQPEKETKVEETPKKDKGRLKGKGKAKAKETPTPETKTPPRRPRKRGAPTAEPEPEPEAEITTEDDIDENDIETEDEIETESESDRSVEQEVPEARR